MPQITEHMETMHGCCVNGFWLVSSLPYKDFICARITCVCRV